jgi:hypothetical protein
MCGAVSRYRFSGECAELSLRGQAAAVISDSATNRSSRVRTTAVWVNCA